jgi:hypothetical protein
VARIRTIKPEFWEDEEIGTLSREARLLLIGTWNLADDEGLLRWTPVYLKAALFMYDDDLTVAKTEKLMEELAVKPIILPYQGGTGLQRLGCIVNFRRHQRINRPQPGRLPPPSLQNSEVAAMYAGRDRWTCHLCGEEVSDDPMIWTDKSKPSLDHIIPRSEGGDDYPSNIRLAHLSCNKARGDREVPFDVSDYIRTGIVASNGASSESKRTEPAPLFDEFWETFPVRRDRPAAERAWAKAVKRAAPGVIIAGAQRYRDDPNRDPTKTKYPAGWLNGDRWTDEAAAATARLALPEPDSGLDDSWLREENDVR